MWLVVVLLLCLAVLCRAYLPVTPPSSSHVSFTLHAKKPASTPSSAVEETSPKKASAATKTTKATASSSVAAKTVPAKKSTKTEAAATVESTSKKTTTSKLSASSDVNEVQPQITVAKTTGKSADSKIAEKATMPTSSASKSKSVPSFKPKLYNGMPMRKLGRSDLVVSRVGLGTLTFGEQVTEEDTVELLDKATKEFGINLLDTAEFYPLPYLESNCGETERIVGRWLKQNGKSFRDKLVLSTKICGYSETITWCRNNGKGTRLTKDQIIYAVDKQLERLQTDYIDLLQFNWPERYVPMHGEPYYDFNKERRDITNIKTQLEVVDELIKSGKVRHYGLSNESPYGIGVYTTLADTLGLPRPCSTQQEYNILERYDFEHGMTEACSPVNGDISVISYSPLGGGALSGKYKRVEDTSFNSRIKRYLGTQHRYICPPAQDAMRAYAKIAEEADIPMAVIALAWIYSQPYITSTLIGATNTQQLYENVMALNIAPLSKEVLAKIDKIYRKFKLPVHDIFPLSTIGVKYYDHNKLPWGYKETDFDPLLEGIIDYKVDLKNVLDGKGK